MKAIRKILGFIPYYFRGASLIRMWNNYCVDLAMAELLLKLSALNPEQVSQELAQSRRGDVREFRQKWALKRRK